MASYLETVREWFRARLDAPGGLSTPEGATLGLRVLAIWRSRMIARALRDQNGGRVLGGPFAGMAYVEDATEGALAPRLIGTYEDELHPYLAEALAADPEVILDIGCAEGYYAAGLARLASFAALAPEIAGKPSAQAHLVSVQQDVQSLTEHAAAQSAHIAFLLDAALGLINIEQNVSIKTFSVFTVLLMPPTLIGAIYGMNFEVMPELTWPWGYPLALGLMVVSGVAPLLWFRHKGWF